MQAFDDSPSLEKLVALASVGDEASVLELYDRYNGVVCRIALHHLRLKGCNALADHSEDIISSAWLVILEHLNQLQHSEKIEPWVNTIILNIVIGHVSGPKGCISSQQKGVPLEAAEEARIEHAEKLCHDAVLANEIRAQAYAKSNKFGEVVRLFIEEEFTMEEVARQLDESPAKLRSMYYRSMSALRKYFRDDRNDDDEPPES